MAITKVPGTTTIKTKNPDLGFTPTVVVKKPAVIPNSATSSLTGAAKALSQSFANPSMIVPPSTYASVPASSGTGAAVGSVAPPPTMADIDPSVYLAQLTSDPIYQSGLTSYQNTLQANQNALAAALKQSIIQGGWTPGTGAGQINLSNVGGQDLSGDIDQSTIDLANQNQMSDRAQLQQQLTKGLADIPSQLAARGAARSGAANIASANVQNQYDVAANQALQNLSQALGGNVSTWAQNNANALAGWNSAQTDVANRLASIAQANAQADYNNQLAAYNASLAASPAPTQITTAPAGPSPATVKLVNQIKSQVSAKKVAANKTGATVAKGRGVISIH